jgi:caffeoyl-CoA O-methyltransferase
MRSSLQSDPVMGNIVPGPIEAYLAQLNRQADAVLADIAAQGVRRDLPLIDAETGALLRVLAMAAGARRILEIGTAIGYSGIWLAGALPPGGMLISMERDPGRAAEARANFERAGLADRASVMVGDAARLVHKVAGPIDVIFQDGDKQLYSPLLDRLVTLLRPGGLLVTDNVLWNGEVVPGLVARPVKNPEDTAAIAAYNERLSSDPRLVTSWVPLRDGLAVSVKRPA